MKLKSPKTKQEFAHYLHDVFVKLEHSHTVVVGRLLAWAEQNPGDYFDSRQAADYIGVTIASLYGLVERKRIVPLRGPRRTYRFTKKQLNHYLATNTQLCV